MKQSFKSMGTFFKEFQRIIREMPIKDIEKAVKVLFEAWKDGKTIFVMGCGGSASTATHFACDLAKSTIIEGHQADEKRFKTISLVDNIPLNSAWINDDGWQSVFMEQLRAWIGKDDVLVGFSVHGGTIVWSQNLNLAVQLAKARKAKVIGFSGFAGGILKEQADACIVVPINKEPLGTPIVESAHVMLHHLICYLLKEKIGDYRKKVWKGGEK